MGTDGLEALEELEMNKDYFKDENKVIKLVSPIGQIGTWYLKSIYDITETHIHGRNLEDKHVNLLKPFGEVKLINLTPLEDYGVELDEDYYEKGQSIEVTFQDGEKRRFRSIESVSYFYLYGTLENGIVQAVKREEIKDIQIISKKDDSLEALDEIALGTNYYRVNEAIKVKTGSAVTYLQSILEDKEAYLYSINMSGEHIRVEKPIQSLEVVKLVSLLDFGIMSLQNYKDTNRVIKVTNKDGAIVYVTELQNIAQIYFIGTGLSGESITLKRDEIENMEIKNMVEVDITNTKLKGIELGKNYVEDEDAICVRTSNGDLYFSSIEPSSANSSTVEGYDLDGNKLSTKLDIVRGLRVVPLHECITSNYIPKLMELNKEQDVFSKYGIEKGKDYRLNNQLLQVTIEDNIFVFSYLEPDLDDWIAGRQFGSITTSIPVKRIQDIKIVNIEDLK
ncbi:hypothetical protein ACQUY5_26220 [Bacillus cereus]|uniref:hypothetical protein n=1 Tax=Bacillus cereus TaxID=1396 RepID=UPI003D1668BF